MRTLKYYNSQTGNFEEVSGEDNKLFSKSFVQDDLSDAAKEGRFFSFTSTYNSSNSDYTAYLRNNASKSFYVVSIEVSSSSNTQFSVFKSSGIAIGGTEVPGLNWNFSSANTAGPSGTFNVSFIQDPDNASVTPVELMRNISSSARSGYEFNSYGSLILNTNDAVTVWSEKSSSSTTTTIIGYFL